MITYWTVGGIYIIMDLTLKPNSLRKYKVQPGKNEPVERIKLYKVSF
jgi:methylsterol monooxygenase